MHQASRIQVRDGLYFGLDNQPFDESNKILESDAREKTLWIPSCSKDVRLLFGTALCQRGKCHETRGWISDHAFTITKKRLSFIAVPLFNRKFKLNIHCIKYGHAPT